MQQLQPWGQPGGGGAGRPATRARHGRGFLVRYLEQDCKDIFACRHVVQACAAPSLMRVRHGRGFLVSAAGTVLEGMQEPFWVSLSAGQ
eukprot:760145-Pelagomonas_calceolata.AAC.3